MEKNNGIKASLFLLVLIIFIVGGFILMKKSHFTTGNDNKIVELNNEDIKDIRLDNSKEHIFFTDVEHITHELDIEYKNININFVDKNNIAKILNDETAELKKTLTYDETNSETVYDNLVSAKYKIYNVYTYDNYISLVVDYYEYHYETLVSYLSTKTYVFDKKDGHLIDSLELLENFEMTKDEVSSIVKTHVTDENIGKTEEELDIDATMQALGDFNLFVDKIGRLSISILVKSDQKDYNEVIVLS